MCPEKSGGATKNRCHTVLDHRLLVGPPIVHVASLCFSLSGRGGERDSFTAILKFHLREYLVCVCQLLAMPEVVIFFFSKTLWRCLPVFDDFSGKNTAVERLKGLA